MATPGIEPVFLKSNRRSKSRFASTFDNICSANCQRLFEPPPSFTPASHLGGPGARPYGVAAGPATVRLVSSAPWRTTRVTVEGTRSVREDCERYVEP